MERVGTTGFTSATDSGTPSTGSSTGTSSGVCASCGQPIGANRTLEQVLDKLGLKDIDLEEYLNTARDYLKSGTNKATSYAKENPGKVAAGAAVVAIGAGLLIAALNRE
jgi:hypothetical protein